MKGVGILTIISLLVAMAYSQRTKEYPLRLQPELDNINTDAYMKNERLLNFQLRCILDEGPCDMVGRFIKPRVARALLGECVMCTPTQEKIFERLIEAASHRPDIYRLLFVRFIEKAGIKVDDDKKQTPAKINEINEKDGKIAVKTDENIQYASKVERISTESIIMAAILPETAKLPETVILSERANLPETVILSETVNLPETGIIPVKTILSETVILSETANLPETGIIPEKTIVSETVILSETTNLPETGIIPEKTILSETVILSETTILPDITLIPETTFNLETTFNPETKYLPETTFVTDYNWK